MSLSIDNSNGMVIAIVTVSVTVIVTVITMAMVIFIVIRHLIPEREEEEEEEEEGLQSKIYETRPTRYRVDPARVSSPQVDLTRCGVDKTPRYSLNSAVQECDPPPVSVSVCQRAIPKTS